MTRRVTRDSTTRGGSLGVFLICWLPRDDDRGWKRGGREILGERRETSGRGGGGKQGEKHGRGGRRGGWNREEWLGNRTLCDFYRELANFAIELYRRQWQSARALDDGSPTRIFNDFAAFHVALPYPCSAIEILPR